jgi:hypothetical protein
MHSRAVNTMLWRAAPVQCCRRPRQAIQRGLGLERFGRDDELFLSALGSLVRLGWTFTAPKRRSRASLVFFSTEKN